MADQTSTSMNEIVNSYDKVKRGNVGSPGAGSPRSKSKAKSILWLKNLLQGAGCVIFEGERSSHVIDDCFQVPLPSLQKYCASLVKESHSNVLNTLTYKNIVSNIRALRSEYVMRIAKPILQKLMSHDRNRNTFNQPVDPVELGIPTYFDVIKRPMDLGTVMSRLRGGKYCTIKACFQDVELVFRNAMLFNHASHEVHKMARDLLQVFCDEVAQAEEKSSKEREKRNQHTCSLCCGSTCQLCGEKCLKYEAPSLNCQQCGTRIKKYGIFYVCADGSALWCQKCYMALPPVIVPGAPRPLHQLEDGGDQSGEGSTDRADSSAAQAEEVTAIQGIECEGALGADPGCAISTCDSDSIHEPVGAAHHTVTSNRDSSHGAEAPLLKKHLLKRRADEEVAEPWVACDSCGNWYHQICALYSKLGEPSAAKTFCCPFCVLMAGSTTSSADLELSLAVAGSGVERGSPLNRRRGSSCDDQSVVSAECSAQEAMDVSDSLVIALPPADATPAVPKLNRGLTVKFESDALFKNIFEYSELSSPHASEGRRSTGLPESPAQSAMDTSASEPAVAYVSANSSCAGTVMTSEDERLLDDESLHGGCAEDVREPVCATTAEASFSCDNGPYRAPTPLVEAPCPAPPVLSPALDAHWKWRAASLPHTQLGDFLESLVRDLLTANGHSEAASSITIRMTTNKDMALEVPASIVQNLISPAGHVIPDCLGYKQKCILLFQEVDGVDVCLFSLYVHEFDARCPSPNTSTVYIAYLDSVDYFRPVVARTMVYQEIVAGYLKWSQARGFKQAHIWSCPPHRGDNFIFNAHPAHQKYPSRERLNHWYKSILQRCSKIGVIQETGNLWQHYFSKYVRRDALPVARQAALNSFVGSGKAVRKSNFKPKPKAAATATEAASATTEAPVAPPAPEPLPPPAIDAPVCPPIFDGDYWVQQYVYLVRLHTQKGKGQSSASQRQQLGARKFRELLKRLMNREESTPFLHPVDHLALGIPHYTLIVKHPMDMSTVKEKLGAGEYPSAFEFVQDVRLIFSNAKLFNPEDHAVHIAAEFLSQKFERGVTLAVHELRELNGNGLLRMPIPGADGGASTDEFLKTVILSQPAKARMETTLSAEPVCALMELSASSETTTIVPSFQLSEDSAQDSSKLGDCEKPGEHVYATPECKAVSRSGSLADEREFFSSNATCPELTILNSGTRSRALSISVTPTASTAAVLLLPPTTSEKTEVEAISDAELEGDLAKRRLQHVVSQDFTAVARMRGCSDDKRKKEEDAINGTVFSSPDSASKRRRLSEDIAPAGAERPAVAPSSDDRSAGFSADALNRAHIAVPFIAPALGSQNTMTIVAELSKRMQRQYDDLFVIKLAPPGAINVTYELPEPAEVPAPMPVPATTSTKKSRGRVAVVVRKTPAMHVPGGLKAMGPTCRALLASLRADTTDPDPAISSPVTDSRHVFLELCQFRHYQFDSLRRAKHSSLMLLYHLQNPHDKCCHACCTHCDGVIQNLRWHCDECPNFDLCATCYDADSARRTGPLHLSHRPSFSVDGSEAMEPPLDTRAAHGRVRGDAGLRLPHPHALTPYRVSHQ